MKEAEKEAERVIEMLTFNCWECGGFETAKQCAILHVNGIIDSKPSNISSDKWGSSFQETITLSKKYWQEVLTIIKNK